MKDAEHDSSKISDVKAANLQNVVVAAVDLLFYTFILKEAGRTNWKSSCFTWRIY